ncbi:ParB family chromosome partitioning protein [Aminobacter lissarensis]|uniref:ParB family chromosome partitioning protein n=1 Tax=Aminobacter carboxidus TaxID=376165 RepID=A0A8E2BEI2_9HYPH|nr:plasmid partitioning protein RepB [Aminobacter lissarensis]MBB6469088.1 ParB family chromosome partitioning protein [Aminobacter lissarensis]
MARKNLLEGLIDIGAEMAATATPYSVRGASKSMIRSIDELAKQADKYLEGEQVVELDPSTIDMSFVADRMGDDQEQYQELQEAIRERGQDTPILVRPHPDTDGRYMVVFGHRRVRVAKELGRKVRAVVKALDDRTHIIAQGQENSARADLTFIERAVFARRLEDLKYGRDVICSALAANEAAVSKMISVTTRIPSALIQKIGAAPLVGRERWVELSLLIAKPSNAEKIDAIFAKLDLDGVPSNDRFEKLFSGLNAKGKPVKKASSKPKQKAWATADKSASVLLQGTPKKASITVKGDIGFEFAEFITGQLDGIYEAFRKSKVESTGD